MIGERLRAAAMTSMRVADPSKWFRTLSSPSILAPRGCHKYLRLPPSAFSSSSFSQRRRLDPLLSRLEERRRAFLQLRRVEVVVVVEGKGTYTQADIDRPVKNGLDAVALV